MEIHCIIEWNRHIITTLPDEISLKQIKDVHINSVVPDLGYVCSRSGLKRKGILS